MEDQSGLVTVPLTNSVNGSRPVAIAVLLDDPRGAHETDSLVRRRDECSIRINLHQAGSCPAHVMHAAARFTAKCMCVDF